MSEPDTIANLIAELREDEVLAAVQARLESGEDVMAILRSCEHGMRLVGEEYAKGTYFISGLIWAGEIFREIMELLQPSLERAEAATHGTIVLICTVQGDIHDIGKNLANLLLRSSGFRLIDLGVDVTAAALTAAAVEYEPDIIGLSVLLAQGLDSAKAMISMLRDCTSERVSRIPVLVGGSLLTDQACRYMGADAYCGSAADGVMIAKRLSAAKGRR
jgi:dimethylamine corrinoid protein